MCDAAYFHTLTDMASDFALRGANQLQQGRRNEHQVVAFVEVYEIDPNALAISNVGSAQHHKMKKEIKR